MVYEPVFKKLPFYRNLTSIINTTLIDFPQRRSKHLNREFYFSVPEEFQECFSNTTDIAYQKTEIQIRFCRRLSNLKSCHEIDDYIPPELEVFINGSLPDLPPFIDSEQKLRKPWPIHITDFCTTLHQNKITMSWFSSQNDNYEYFFTIQLVEHVSHEDIVKSIDTSLESNSKNLVIKNLSGINKKLSTNADLFVTSLTVSLLCPLSMQRINVPTRSIYCTHVQCFDVFNYLQINEFKPNWKCPVCRDKAPFETLFIDELFKKILKEKTVANEIVFAADGSWKISPSDSFKFANNSPVKKDVSQNSILNRSSPCTQKRYRRSNSRRSASKSRVSTPKNSDFRTKQKFAISTPCIFDAIKKIECRNKSIDVIDLTLDSSGEF